MQRTRNITINGQRTSVCLEKKIWEALEEICHREKLTRHQLFAQLEAHRKYQCRSANARCYCVAYFQAAATEAGHMLVGHGTLPSHHQNERDAISVFHV